MALGDGIRRNVATISDAERDRLRDALLALKRTKFYPDGVSFWDKQEDIHKGAHAGGADVHTGPAFLPWHRDLVNRMEDLLREVDPELSLHYWDWTTDPTDLFTTRFMGNAHGDIGAPFTDFHSTEDDEIHNGHKVVWRDLRSRDPIGFGVLPDDQLLRAGDGLPESAQYPAFLKAMNRSHDRAHSFIAGTIANPHYSFHDPFVFLLHSDVDRLWAMWQTAPGQEWRLDPLRSYGSDGIKPSIVEALEPWAGNSHLRPWGPPENLVELRTPLSPSVLMPRRYDTLPTLPVFAAVEGRPRELVFKDIPENETTVRAAVVRIYGCGDATLEVKPGSPGAPYSVLPPGTTRVPYGPRPFGEGRIWLTFTGQAPGTSAPADSVTIRCPESNQEFAFTVNANSVARPSVAVGLVLDQSGSMDNPAGKSGSTRITALRRAASRFVELLPNGDGVGLIRFDTDAYQVTDPKWPGLPVVRVGPGVFDPNRALARTAVGNHRTNAAGWTSIGDGVAMGRDLLNSAGGFDRRAMVVFTDGIENEPKFIRDVLASIDDRTFAIGLGSAAQVSTAALNTLTRGTGGYLLLTDELAATIDDTFRLDKCFLQILAGVTNSSIVLDPDGFVSPGAPAAVDFLLTEQDQSVTVILLDDIPAVQLRLRTPAGDIIDPALAASFGGTYGDGTRMSFYRLNLPVPVGAAGHEGRWQALIEVDGPRLDRLLEKMADDPEAVSRARTLGIQFNLNIHSDSRLRLDARLEQRSLEPGALLEVSAALDESGLPVRGAGVRAEVRLPDRSRAVFGLVETTPGRFAANIPTFLPGVYHLRVVATGETVHRTPFTREQLLTGIALPGGDGPFPVDPEEPTGQR